MLVKLVDFLVKYIKQKVLAGQTGQLRRFCWFRSLVVGLCWLVSANLELVHCDLELSSTGLLLVIDC